MKKWEDFEIKIFKYLRRRYSRNGLIEFRRLGDANSTILDIEVVGPHGNSMFLETKSPEAQAGQFVVKLENDKYEFQPNSNHDRPTLKQQGLIDYINQLKIRSNRYVEIKGYPQQKIAELIKEHYQRKRASYFVTGKFEDTVSDVAIIPVDQLDKAFNCSVCLRKKRSGSRSLSQKLMKDLVPELKDILYNVNFDLEDYSINNSRLTLTLKLPIGGVSREDLYLKYKEHNLYLSKIKNSNNNFELKELSKTNNTNLIYSLEYKWIKEHNWLERFIRDLDRL